MSLEAAVTELTSSINKLINITQALHDLRADAIEKTTAAAATGPKSTTKADKADKTAADKGAISDNPDNRVNPIDALTDAASDYIGASDREEERAARKEKVKALLNHEKIRDPKVEAGKGLFSTIQPEAHDLFKSQIAKLKEKGDITTPKKADDDLLD
ncbi:hypothetical protein SAMN05428983_0874 [Agrobacterium fabrum]|uniref:Uncharacterized protein n=1 Tax=Agrobacterium fabrum TaxID=1176649 RepID=A0A7Z7BHK0_9HYPH|nr:hypothetical protein [Agrobacterium fabrum]SDJ26152.1 hypothetical protein SAMN05428983_0874 [Agrobacterium fabrum]